MLVVGDPVKTAERFPMVQLTGRLPTKMYRSGDAGRVLPDGQLECLGRIDSTVKIRGFKVSLPFVESTIKEQAHVASAAVLPLMDETINAATALVCYIVGSGGALMSEEHLAALKQSLRSALPEYSIPSHWVPMLRLPTKGDPPFNTVYLPRSYSGNPGVNNQSHRGVGTKGGESRKLDRQALPKLVPPRQQAASERASKTASPAGASGRLEEVLLLCWEVRTGALDSTAPYHTGPIRRVIRSAGNLCLWHRL
jgi:hypothetical protein